MAENSVKEQGFRQNYHKTGQHVDSERQHTAQLGARPSSELPSACGSSFPNQPSTTTTTSIHVCLQNVVSLWCA